MISNKNKLETHLSLYEFHYPLGNYSHIIQENQVKLSSNKYFLTFLSYKPYKKIYILANAGLNKRSQYALGLPSYWNIYLTS